jgi:hypothetical protein
MLKFHVLKNLLARMELLEGGGTFRRCGLVGGYEATGSVPLKKMARCQRPDMSPGLGKKWSLHSLSMVGACTVSPTVFFPAPGILTFVLTSP